MPRICKTDVVFVLDNSRSIGKSDPAFMAAMVMGLDVEEIPPPKDWKQALDFVQFFSDQFDVQPDKDHIAVVDFGDEANVDFNLVAHTDKESLAAAIKGVTYKGGRTNLSGGLRDGRKLFDKENGGRDDARNVLILVSDGMANVDTEFLDEQIALAKVAARVIVIGIGEEVHEKEEELKSIATNEHDYVYAESFDDLKHIHFTKDEHCDVAVWPPPTEPPTEPPTTTEPPTAPWTAPPTTTPEPITTTEEEC
jgi:hypothetical protein